MKLANQTNRMLFFVGLSLPLLALLAIGWLVKETSGRFQESFYQIAHTYKALSLIEQTQLHLLDVETERRGYLLAGGREYLDSYGKAMQSLQQDIGQLQVLANQVGGQKTNIAELQNLISIRLGIDPDKMSVTNLPDVLALSLTAEGKNTIDQINLVLFQMRQEEEGLLNEREQRAEADAFSSQVATVILISTVAVALIFIIFILLRLERLQQFVTICAWTGQVQYEGEWIRLDEYLQRRFGLSVSHGLSKEAAEKMVEEIRRLNKTPDV